MRRSKVIFGAVAATVLISVSVWAASVTFNITTTPQDTYIQNTLIPAANTELCSQFGLSGNCTGSQLTTAGCVAQAASAVTKTNLVYQNCTPFTLDATGESNFAADLFAKALIARVANDHAADVAASCVAFKAASTANQNTACAAVSRPNGCSFCN